MFEQNAPFHGDIVLALHILQTRLIISRLPLIVIIRDLGIPQPQLQTPIGVAQGSDFLLQSILRAIRLSLRLLMLRLPFLHFECLFLQLLFQFALAFLGIVYVALELLFKFFAAGLEVCEVGFELFVLFLVVV